MRVRAVILALTMLAACGGSEGVTTSTSNATRNAMIELPPPTIAEGVSLTDTMAARRSVREYRETPLELAELSQLLWATQGITSPAGQRTAPSAGGLYPLEIYVVTAAGRHHYHPADHQLELLAEGDFRPELAEAALSQDPVAKAPATFVIAAVYARTAQKYGERAERYVEIEVGHAAQNLLLQAVALDLGAVPVGAFHDDQVAAVLDLPADHEPLYLIPVGHPAT
ncbi:MAG: SagB/ThcOx family dehydrogenase [Acidimicrobiia bacterium]|nr:SagB/ThcOx family dehydrogenase [Acidimicrobiia bacterium]